MQVLRHGAAVLLQPRRLARGDTDCMRDLLVAASQELRRAYACRHAAERSGQVPAALMVLRRSAPRARTGLKPAYISKH